MKSIKASAAAAGFKVCVSSSIITASQQQVFASFTGEEDEMAWLANASTAQEVDALCHHIIVTAESNSEVPAERLVSKIKHYVLKWGTRLAAGGFIFYAVFKMMKHAVLLFTSALLIPATALTGSGRHMMIAGLSFAKSAVVLGALIAIVSWLIGAVKRYCAVLDKTRQMKGAERIKQLNALGRQATQAKNEIKKREAKANEA